MENKELIDKAGEFCQWFEVKSRDNNETFVTCNEGRPEELRDLIYSAHGEYMPDDFIYSCVWNSLELIAQMDEDDDLDELVYQMEADVYNHELLRWVSSNLQRMSAVDEAMQDYHIKSFSDLLMQAQIGEKEEIFNSVLASLTEIVEALEV